MPTPEKWPFKKTHQAETPGMVTAVPCSFAIIPAFYHQASLPTQQQGSVPNTHALALGINITSYSGEPSIHGLPLLSTISPTSVLPAQVRRPLSFLKSFANGLSSSWFLLPYPPSRSPLSSSPGSHRPICISPSLLVQKELGLCISGSTNHRWIIILKMSQH